MTTVSVASIAAMLVRLFIQERSELNEQSRTPCPPVPITIGNSEACREQQWLQDSIMITKAIEVIVTTEATQTIVATVLRATASKF